LGLKDHDTFNVMARLKPGVTLEQARADLDVIYHQALAPAASMLPDSERAIRAQRIKLEPGLRGDGGDFDDLGRELRVLMAVVGLVLLIASINVANLLLARGTARRKEFAVRLVLGAGRGRLVRQLLVESVLLALLGGAAGLLLANWLVAALMFVLSYGRDPVLFALAPDPRVLAFTGAVSLLTGILSGLAPALAATRADLDAVLKSEEGRAPSRTGGNRLASSFVVWQVALSVVLLVGAGLLLRSLRQLYRFEPGFERSHVVMAWVFPVLNGYDHAREMALYSELSERINAVPGVQSASLARLRLVFGRWFRDVWIQGAAPTVTENPQVYCNLVGPRFFETMRIPLLLGREFSPADTETAPKVAVISESMAHRFFANANPLGRRIGFEGPESSGAIEVVGVAGDIRHHPDERRPHESVYIPYTQAPLEELGQMNIVVRTASPAGIAAAIRRQVKRIDRNLPLRDIETQEEEIGEYLAGQRSLALLLSVFGVLALLLAAIGLYGTLSYAVGTRTRELGIRMALGARGGDLVRMVLRRALRQVALGVLIGIPAAIAAAKLAGSLLFGVTSADPVALGAAGAALGAAAVAAAWFPARRATKVDPVSALR
jgi:predicted permease